METPLPLLQEFLSQMRSTLPPSSAPVDRTETRSGGGWHGLVAEPVVAKSWIDAAGVDMHPAKTAIRRSRDASPTVSELIAPLLTTTRPGIAPSSGIQTPMLPPSSRDIPDRRFAVSFVQQLSDGLSLERIQRLTSSRSYQKALSEHRLPFSAITARKAYLWNSGRVIAFAASIRGTAVAPYESHVALTELGNQITVLGWNCTCPAAERTQWNSGKQEDRERQKKHGQRMPCKHIAAVMLCLRQACSTIELDVSKWGEEYPVRKESAGSNASKQHNRQENVESKTAGGERVLATAHGVKRSAQSETNGGLQVEALEFEECLPSPQPRALVPSPPPGIAELFAGLKEPRIHAHPSQDSPAVTSVQPTMNELSEISAPAPATPIKSSLEIVPPATAPRQRTTTTGASPPSVVVSASPQANVSLTRNALPLVGTAGKKRRLPEEYLDSRTTPKQFRGFPQSGSVTAPAAMPVLPVMRKRVPPPPPGQLFRLTETELIDASKRFLAPIAEKRLKQLEEERKRNAINDGEDEVKGRKEEVLKERAGELFEVAERLDERSKVQQVPMATQQRNRLRQETAMDLVLDLPIAHVGDLNRDTNDGATDDGEVELDGVPTVKAAEPDARTISKTVNSKMCNSNVGDYVASVADIWGSDSDSASDEEMFPGSLAPQRSSSSQHGKLGISPESPVGLTFWNRVEIKELGHGKSLFTDVQGTSTNLQGGTSHSLVHSLVSASGTGIPKRRSRLDDFLDTI
ncbi:hypothetical protein HDU93_008143 [Gonapodya sp. JEL0774]|nr:hypothetical protein HDU93_008143 [Gonapodya sp. JEL0774]